MVSCSWLLRGEGFDCCCLFIVLGFFRFFLSHTLSRVLVVVSVGTATRVVSVLMLLPGHALLVVLFVVCSSTSPLTLSVATSLVKCPKSCVRPLYSHCTRSGSAAVNATTSSAGESPTNIVVVRSERNSGSNWLNDILMHNTHDLWYKGLEPMRGSCVVIQGTMGLFGWKHAHLTAETDEPFAPNMLLIVLVRDAIRWLVSMYHHPYTGKTEQGKWMGPVRALIRCSVGE